jgi:glyoxylase-like metal-dependent hydrolase (beta-lactamase superfamily II)
MIAVSITGGNDMRLADNVEMLEIESPGPHHPVLVWDDRDVVLIDASFPGNFDALAAEIARAGFTTHQITRVIVTHQDVDHTGAARRLRAGGATIAAGRTEVPFIQGDVPLTKITDLEALTPPLAPERASFLAMLQAAAPEQTVPVDVPLDDGHVVDWCGGMRAIATPGHTPGHMAVLLLGCNIVVCGDAANIVDGTLCGPRPAMTHDMAAGMRSLERLKALGAAGYVSYHTGYLPA